VTTSAVPTPTSHLLGQFGTTPLSPKITISKTVGSGLTSPQAGGASLSGVKSHGNLLTTTNTTKLPAYQQVSFFSKIYIKFHRINYLQIMCHQIHHPNMNHSKIH